MSHLMGVAVLLIAAVFVALQVTQAPTAAPPVGPGPSISGYNLIDTAPYCYFTLGTAYCPAANSSSLWSNLYMVIKCVHIVPQPCPQPTLACLLEAIMQNRIFSHIPLEHPSHPP